MFCWKCSFVLFLLDNVEFISIWLYCVIVIFEWGFIGVGFVSSKFFILDFWVIIGVWV